MSVAYLLNLVKVYTCSETSLNRQRAGAEEMTSFLGGADKPRVNNN